MSSTGSGGAQESHPEGSVTLGLRVQGQTKAQIDQLTQELQLFLKQRTENLAIERRREDAETQDAGSLLDVLLAAPAVVELAKGLTPALLELAKGIADFMRRRNVSVEISANGTARVEGRPDLVESLVHELLLAQIRRDGEVNGR